MHEFNDNGVPKVIIANLYNNYNSLDNDNSQVTTRQILLKPISLEEHEFFSLFFSSSSKKFFINKSQRNNKHIQLASQSIIDESGYKKFNFCDELLNEFVLKNSTNKKSEIDSKILLGLHKEVKNIDSLANIQGSQITTNWNEIAETLSLRDEDVLFQIKFNYYSKTIENTHLEIVFQYHVNVTQLFSYLKNENTRLKERGKNKKISKDDLDFANKKEKSDLVKPLETVDSSATKVLKRYANAKKEYFRPFHLSNIQPVPFTINRFTKIPIANKEKNTTEKTIQSSDKPVVRGPIQPTAKPLVRGPIQPISKPVERGPIQPANKKNTIGELTNQINDFGDLFQNYETNDYDSDLEYIDENYEELSDLSSV